MQRKVYPVSAVNRYVKQLLQQDMILSGLWVSGELSNFKRHSSGHLYFTLKDQEGSIAAVMFASDARSLTFRPQDGQQVQVQGYISLYEKTGQYQLYVRKMEPQGSGQLYQAFEALKQKLQAQGLFDEQRKKTIPAYPRKIGIVTSQTGAAVRDMIQIARRRYPGVQLVLYPALVQGIDAAPTIVKGIQTLDRMSEVDVIIVGRGGGSIEDLWPFNEEMVAMAIAEAQTPIVSAVGHETDFTIADFVSDLRAPTPSAAAELTVPDVRSTLGQMDMLEQRRYRALQRKQMVYRQQLALLWQKVQSGDPRRKLDELRQQLDMQEQRQLHLWKQCMQQRQYKLEHLSSALELLSPQHQLDKGYAMVMDGEGRVVSAVEQVKKGQALNIRLKDGKIAATVDTIQKTRKQRRKQIDE